jgi:hypothetical protein
MIGRFNQTLHILNGTNKVRVAGTFDSEINDDIRAGDTVTIDVTKLAQNGRVVACHQTFPIVNPSQQLAWQMDVSASHFTAGAAEGAATATIARTGRVFAWTAPANPNPFPPPDPTPAIQIVQD